MKWTRLWCHMLYLKSLLVILKMLTAKFFKKLGQTSFDKSFWATIKVVVQKTFINNYLYIQ
jgi:hypothetical protein